MMDSSMPISYVICGNGHIEHIIISEPWTLENLIELYAQRRSVLDHAVHKMHAMAVLRDVRTIPFGAISWACSQQIERHPNLGYTAILGCSRLLRGVGETI